jgi:feruloyl esterase
MMQTMTKGLAFLAALLSTAPCVAGTCAALTNVLIAKGQVTRATAIGPGKFVIPGGNSNANVPAFCRVELLLTPSTDSAIHAEVWLPDAWNERFQGTGNGGFAGKISYAPLVAGLARGYAVANSDMGMSTQQQESAAIFTGRPERWADWGYRATHQMTVAAKLLVRAFYGKPARKAYFTGCSTGGEQGLMEAQRFPEDYDGIVAGAPANNRTGVHMSILWNFAATHRDPTAGLPEAKLKLLEAAVLQNCDGMDGVKDGILNDPRTCLFEPERLQCSGTGNDGCLTAEQVQAVRRVYEGPRDTVTGARIYPGVPRGSESEWGRFGTPPFAEPPFAPIFEWVFGRDWDWRAFDFGADAARMARQLSPILNANNADLSAFRSAGHKLMVYHGWADWLVVPEESIKYYEAVRARMGSSAEEFYRLYMVPGMRHCSGGSGADRFDMLSPMVDWVEHGRAPGSLTATKYASNNGTGDVLLTRPLCPYPRQARYAKGDTNLAESFTCSASGGRP